MEKNLLIHTFSEIYLLLNGKQKKGILLLFFGIIVSGILDLIGLAAILGVIGLAVSPEIIFENQWVNSVFEGLGYTDTTGFIILVISAMLVLFIFKVILGMGIIYQQKTYIFDLTQDIIRRMYVYYFSRNYAFVRKIDSGNLITNIHNIPSHFVMDILEPATMLLSETFVAISIVVVIAAIDFKLLIFLGIIMGTAFGLIYWSLRNRVYQLGMKKKVIAPEAIRLINESILGYIPIKLFDRISFFSTNYMKVQNEEYTVRKWISFFNEIPMKINEFLMVSGIFLVFLYGLLFLDDRENFLIMMGTLAVSAYRVMPSLNRILKSLVNIKRSQYLLDILSVLKGEAIEHDKEVEPLRLKEKVEFINLSFQFEDSEKPVLDEVSFTVHKGNQIGLIGESGSGKTTLMRILLRMFTESEGEIRVDGVKLTAENERSWQKNVGYVQQEIFVIEGTVAENIAFGLPSEQINHEKVNRAIEMARLSDFVNSLPEGMNSPIGEFGSNLSGGQKQRIAIARALYRDVDVFVLDEATSALDPETEQTINESVAALKRLGKTIFIIAHRFTTLKGCDVIYELELGKIARKYQYHELIREKLGLIEEK